MQYGFGKRRLYLPLPRFSYLRGKMKPFTFEELLGYTLEEKNYNELQTVKDCQVFTYHENIFEIINIIDMNTKFRVPNCVIDGQRIIFIDPALEGHVVFLNYNAGFTETTLPADLKEAITKLFIKKKKEFLILQNTNESTKFEIPEDIQSVIIVKEMINSFVLRFFRRKVSVKFNFI